MPLNLSLAKSLVERAKKLGADEAEVYSSSVKQLKIDVLDGKLEALDNIETSGIAVRVIKDKKMGFAYTGDIEDESMEQALTSALENSKSSAADEFNRFAESGKQNVRLELVDPQIQKANVRDKIELTMNVEKSARSFDAKVKKTEKISYEDSIASTIIANSKGVAVSYQKSVCGLYADVIAEANGEMESGSWLQFATKFARLNAEEVGKVAAKKAVVMLGAKPEKSGRASIVFSPYAAATILAVLSQALSAEFVQKGKSLFVNSVGKPVASRKFTLTDSGILPDQPGSSPYDDEGTPAGETLVIQDGFLKGFLYDSYTAGKEKRASTGNSFRGSFMSRPDISPSNLYVKPGLKDKDAMIAHLDKGFLVEEVMGAHTINPISGDFSIGFSGFFIDGGVLSRPVRSMTISANVLDLLTHFEEAGSDLMFFPMSGSVGSPSLLISNLSVSGS